MKKILYFAAVMLLLIGCQDNSGLSGLLTDYDSRIAELEKVCTEMNTNITSMQTIINAYESGDVITNISPLVQNGEEVGYIITFSNHESIILYHGKNGNDGATGAKGEDGITPNIGVKQDTDGIYYWTLNGEWLLGDNGEKLPVSGKDGTDGSKGETGAQGDKGDKGDTGDSFFQSVTQDDDYVYFTLTDGTVIKIAKGGNNNSNSGNVKIVDGAIQYAFSVSDTSKVYFSQGNLQYDRTTYTWSFAENQYDHIGNSDININEQVDLFGWSYATGPLWGLTLASPSYPDWNLEFIEWGTNAISNGGHQPNQWRTLTSVEWDYLFEHYTYRSVYINDVPGVIIFNSISLSILDFIPDDGANLSINGWEKLRQNGVIFLPSIKTPNLFLSTIYYWSSTKSSERSHGLCAYHLYYNNGKLITNVTTAPGSKAYAVRLVQDVIE